jgi:hypothetical protein
MGNSCVADGHNPYSMGYYLINNSSKKLTLSEDICNESCKEHRGFNAHRGKFKLGWQPTQMIEAGGDSKCWMSARDTSSVSPAGWVIYNIEGGGTLNIEFDYIEMVDLQNQRYLTANVFRCESVKVSVKQKSIESIIRNGFEDSDVIRQFEIIISDNGNADLSVDKCGNVTLK